MKKKKKLGAEDRVLLCNGTQYKLIKLKDVRYFETYSNYTKTYFNGGKSLIYKTLSSLENRLSDTFFFRANRQFIINLTHIHHLQLTKNSTFSIEMSCGKKIILSRRRSREFKGVMSL